MGDRDQLLDHLERTTGLRRDALGWLVDEIVGFYRETASDYAKRRHRELRRRGRRNDEIYRCLVEELAARPVRSPAMSERQIRRLVTG